MNLMFVCLAMALADDDPEAAWGGATTSPPVLPAEEEPPPAGWSAGASSPAPAPLPPAPGVTPAPPVTPPPPAPPPVTAPVSATPPATPPPATKAPPATPPPIAPAAEDSSEADDAPVLDPAEIVGAAVDAPDVNIDQLAWLKPKLSELPPNPRAHTDFTAYTLEWGEFRLGLVNAQLGILPRTQLGTSVPLDLLGLYNLNAKVNPLHLGPWDLALSAAHFRLVQPDFFTGYTSFGLINSFTVNPHLSLHLGANLWTIHMEGIPDLAAIHPALQLDAATVAQAIDPLDYASRVLSLRPAVDVRFNRRDSLIFQLNGAIWTKNLSPELPDLPPLEALTSLASSDGLISPTSVYSASVAYQMDFRRLSLRVGAGLSSTRGAWLLQSFDLAYRFGGPTLGDERRQRSSWRRTKRERGEHP